MTVTVVDVSRVLGDDPQNIRTAARRQLLPTIRQPDVPRAKYHFRPSDVVEYARRSGYNADELERISEQLAAILAEKNAERGKGN